MRPPRRVAFIGNSLPRRCGIATFTTDLQQAIAASEGGPDTAIVAMTDEGRHYDYPPVVRLQVHDGKLEEYKRAAHFLNAEQFEVACLQHEFGIFGGDAGSHIMTLLAHLRMPIVTTLHTVLAEPNPIQYRVLREIIDISTTVIVMAEKGRELLRAEYAIAAEKIDIIPHGIPDCAFVEPDAAKLGRGFSNRAVILTFGLISPNKGIEFMIEAMPAILRSRGDAVYVVLGATHPNLVRLEGEASAGGHAYVAAGLRSLRWLMRLQTADGGFFRPVGSQSFGDKRSHPRTFDQQPLQATAAISACLAAWRTDGDLRWRAHAVRAFEWFLGSNDLSTPLVDLETGSCCDGLHPGRPNENRGGESVVSYLLGLAEMRRLAGFAANYAQPARLRAFYAPKSISAQAAI